MLLGHDGLPMPYPNLFVTIHHRNQSDASNTCYTVFEHIRYLYEICSFLKIDLVQRCKVGHFLSKQEVESIAKWAKRTVKTFREHVEKNQSKKVVSFTPKAHKLETARSVIVVDHQGDISSYTAYNRLTTFADYIGWLENELYSSKESTTGQSLKRLRPRKLSTNSGADDVYKSLTKVEVARVLDVVRPDSTDNPWKDESLRYRNQLIVNMFEAIGLRRGELLKLRVPTNNEQGDIKTNPKNGRRYLTIRSKIDFDDDRKDRPEAKTLGRHVPMDNRLSEMYENYLIYHRSNVNGAEVIPYLFVTHNHRTSTNQALSTAAINKVFRELSYVVGFRVHPHVFRHTWNDRFSEHADKRIAEGKVSAAKSESDRQKLMGWSENSKMARHYSKRHDDKRAFEVGLELQESSSALNQNSADTNDLSFDQ